LEWNYFKDNAHGRIEKNEEGFVIWRSNGETISLHRLCWFGHVQRMEGNRIPIRVLYMNLETPRLGGRPRNGRQDEVREDGRIVGGEEWQEKVYNRVMEEAAENGKELSHSAHGSGMHEQIDELMNIPVYS
jgi:hypothetical protein